MWNVMLCDDEAFVRAELKGFFERFGAEAGCRFNMVECSSAEQLLCQVKPDTDLVFLDIRMESMDGMRAAHLLRGQYPDLCIIFLTSMVSYALEGYRVHAFGFIQKPLAYAQFRLQMADVLNMLRSRRRESIALKIGFDTYNIDPRALVYAEVQNHSIKLQLTDRQLNYYGTISDLERVLPCAMFSRCHKSFLVNLYRVKHVAQADIYMDNSDVLPLSKRRRREFLEALTSCLGSAIA